MCITVILRNTEPHGKTSGVFKTRILSEVCLKVTMDNYTEVQHECNLGSTVFCPQLL